MIQHLCGQEGASDQPSGPLEPVVVIRRLHHIDHLFDLIQHYVTKAFSPSSASMVMVSQQSRAFILGGYLHSLSFSTANLVLCVRRHYWRHFIRPSN